MLSLLLVEDDSIICNEFKNHVEEYDDITLIGVTNNSKKRKFDSLASSTAYYLALKPLIDLDFQVFFLSNLI